MAQFRDKTNGDVITVFGPLEVHYAGNPGFEPYTEATPIRGLDLVPGAVIDEALGAAGLPKSGTVKERRERLLETVEPEKPTEKLEK
jgi:hypothetical protein